MNRHDIKCFCLGLFGGAPLLAVGQWYIQNHCPICKKRIKKQPNECPYCKSELQWRCECCGSVIINKQRT